MSTLNVRAVKSLPVKRSEPRLDRTTFTTSRLLDFCNERELTAQIGHPVADWPLVIGKELADNALDACEEAGIAPEIDIRWVEIDTPNAGPKGAKGVGEPPCVPTAGAVANGIAAVLGRHLDRLPMTPERVWAAANGIEA